MDKSTSTSVRLRDPLSEVTRRERRFLLGVSLIGIVLVKSGLIPQKIAGLGIEFTSTDQRSFLLAVLAVVCYFLVAFLIYGSSDFIAWRIALHDALIPELTHEFKKEIAGWADVDDPDPDPYDKHVMDFEDNLERKRRRVLQLVTPTSVMRAGFEFGIPIATGVLAAYWLIAASNRI